MPSHRVHLDDLEDEIARIEATEKIISTERHGDVLIVITEPAASAKRRAPGERETR
jgi:hypothetical protein